MPTLDGQRLYLKVPHQDAIVDLDSCEVIHGIFRMDGEVDSVTFGPIYIGEESLMPVVVEKGKIKSVGNKEEVLPNLLNKTIKGKFCYRCAY